MWLYGLAIPAGLVLVSYCVLACLGQCGFVGVLLLVFAEVAFVGLGLGVIWMQPRHPPGLHFIKNVYTEVHNTTQYDTNLSHFDPELGYLYKASIRSGFGNWEFGPNEFHTNTLGLRDDEASAKDPVIIALGDSFTTGWGVEQHETYAQRLEELTKVKVLNGGVSSFGTVREALLLKKLPRDSCRLLIVQYCYNDLAENKKWADALLAGKQYQPSFDQENFYRRQLQNAAGYQYVPFKYTFEIGKKAAKFLFLKPGDHDPFARHGANKPQDHVQYFFRGIKLIRQFYRGNIVVISTSNSLKADTEFIQTAQSHADSSSFRNLHFLNVAGTFKDQDNYVVDGHNTASGHLSIARQLFTFIQKHNLLTQPNTKPSLSLQ